VGETRRRGNMGVRKFLFMVGSVIRCSKPAKKEIKGRGRGGNGDKRAENTEAESAIYSFFIYLKGGCGHGEKIT